MNRFSLILWAFIVFLGKDLLASETFIKRKFSDVWGQLEDLETPLGSPRGSNLRDIHEDENDNDNEEDDDDEEDENRSLWELIYKGSSSRVARGLRKKRFNPNEKNESRQSPLFYACSFKKVKLAHSLLKYGADKEEVDKLGFRPLHHAVLKKSKKLVKVLIKAEVDLNPTNFTDNTPLHYAIHLKLYDIAQELLEAGADPNIYNNKGLTALHLACIKGDQKAVELMVEKGKNLLLDRADLDRDRCALHLAIMSNNLYMVAYLLKHGASLSPREEEDPFKALERPLYTALKYESSPEILKLVLIYSSALNQRTKSSVPLIDEPYSDAEEDSDLEDENDEENAIIPWDSPSFDLKADLREVFLEWTKTKDSKEERLKLINSWIKKEKDKYVKKCMQLSLKSEKKKQHQLGSRKNL